MNDFYVAVKEPKKLRRSLLTGSKDILSVLKMSQDLIDLRNEKLFVMDVLKQELAELQLLFEKLQEKFPEEMLDDAPVRPILPTKKKEKDHTLPEMEMKVEEPRISAMEGLRNIEEQLAAVEEKLKNLD